MKAAKKRPPIKASLWHAALCVVISSRNNTYLEIQRLRDNEPTLTAHLENLHGAILATEVTLAQQLSDHGHVLPTGCYYETLKKRQ